MYAEAPIRAPTPMIYGSMQGTEYQDNLKDNQMGVRTRGLLKMGLQAGLAQVNRRSEVARMHRGGVNLHTE